MKTSKKNLYKLIFSYKTLGFIFVLAQLVFFAACMIWLQDYSRYLYGLSTLAALIAIIYELNRETNNAFKISWLILIAILPVMGILLCFFTRYNSKSRKDLNDLISACKKTEPYTKQNIDITNEIKKNEPELFSMSNYLYKTAGFPTYRNGSVKYYPCGDIFYDDYIKHLSEAKNYIFIEFFIINSGDFWDSVLYILKKKASEGVEIKLMFDGMGCLAQFDRKYPDVMKKHGIDCKIFAPVRPFLSTYQNNRDHRKITVIDGKVAFTGGINLADEYINKFERFGHWKDNAILIKGAAVSGFTAMFLQMWQMASEKEESIAKYFNVQSHSPETTGYIIPFCDNPLDDETVGRNVYFGIINSAVNYVHIMTPYLILDNEMLDSLKFASKRGVDVKILMPGVPDKWYAFILAKTYYPELIKSGVKIYEYTPGFVHAKTMVSDDKKAVVGTINQDFRSMYLHYECAAYLYKVPQIKEIENDFSNTLKKSTKMFIGNYKKLSLLSRAIGRLLRIFAPLM